MSDSDETICNEDGDISETEEQNSPSILASWYQTDKERKEVSEEMKENDTGLKESRTNLLKIDVNDFYRGSGSPEFPLISRELKRKEHSTEPSVLNSDDNSKVIRGEHGFLDSSDGERRETEDVSTNLNETLLESEGDGMAKTQALLMTLETAMTVLETDQNSGDDANVSFNAENRLEDIKCQLALLQKALVEINHKNQETRKKIISTEGSRQLSEEKKLAILSLAKKQRNVLEVFKKYKNLVQRFKQVKHQNDNALQEKCLEREGTSFSQTRSVENTEFSMKNIEQPENPEGSEVSLVSTETSAKTARALPAHQTGSSITFVEESHPAKINTLEQMPTRSEKSLMTVDTTKSIRQPSSGGNPVPGAKSKIIIVSSGVGGLISQNVASQSAVSSSSGASMEGRSARHIAIPNQVTTNQSAKKHTTPTSLEVSLLTKSIPQMQSYLTLSSGPAIVHTALTCLTTASCTKTNPTVTMHSANAYSVTRSTAQSQPRLSQCVQRLSQSRQNDHHTSTSGPTFTATAARPNTVNAHPANTISQSLTYYNVPSNPTKTTSQCVQGLSQNSQKTHHTSLSGHFPATTIAKTNYPITPTNDPTNTNSQSNCIYPIVPTTREITSHYVQDPPQSIQKTHPTLSSGPFPTTTIANTNSTGTNYPTTINSLRCQRPSVPPTTRVTTLHSISAPAQSRERVQREPYCTTVGQCYKTTSNAANSLPNTNQGSSKQIAGIPVSLETLMKKGVVTPGRNVLTATAEGKLYCASLSEKGTIISAGGEGFTSPRSWVKAILGRKSKVKHDVAWKMVSYKGKTLLDFANESIAEPPKQKSAISSSSISKNVDSITIYRDQKSPNLINSAAALTALLKHCRVTRVEKEELVPSDDILTKDFWLKTEFELESLKDVLFGLEF